MTLIEVLVVSLLLTLVAGAMMPVLTTSEQLWRHTHRRMELVQNARIGMDHLIDRLRAAETFVTVNPPTLIRFSYFYGDGTSIYDARYQLNLATNELEYRSNSGSFRPLAGPFRSLSVTCFDVIATPVACAPIAPVRSVEVSLVVMDLTGEVADITMTARAFRQVP